MNRSNVCIINIHGTFDGDIPTKQKKWWRENSEFSIGILAEIKRSGLVGRIHEFIWSGENSETARRKAASALAGYIRECKDNDEKCVLIGHSHGGNIISKAYEIAQKKGINTDHVLKNICIGSAFLDFETGVFTVTDTFKRLVRSPFFWVFTSIIVSYIMFAIYVMGSNVSLFFLQLNQAMRIFIWTLPDNSDLIKEKQEELSIWIPYFKVVYYGSFLASVYFSFIFLITIKNFFLPPKKENIKNIDREKWIFLFHTYDEVINGLRFVHKSKSAPLFRNTKISSTLTGVARSFVSTLSFVFIPYIILSVYISFFWRLFDINDQIPFNSLFIFALLITFYSILAAIVVVTFFFLNSIFRLIGYVLDPIYQKTLAHFFDWRLARLIKRQLMGADLLSENVVEVSTTPWFLNDEAKPLQDPLHSKMLDDTTEVIVDSAYTIRRAMGQSYMCPDSYEFSSLVSDSVPRGMLIHTSYFKYQEIRNIIGVSIAKSLKT